MFQTGYRLQPGTRIHKSLWQVLEKKGDRKHKSVAPFSSCKLGTVYCCFTPIPSSLFSNRLFMEMLFLTLWL